MGLPLGQKRPVQSARARAPRPGLRAVAREGAVVRAPRRVVAVGIPPLAAAPAAASACQVP